MRAQPSSTLDADYAARRQRPFLTRFNEIRRCCIPRCNNCAPLNAFGPEETTLWLDMAALGMEP